MRFISSLVLTVVVGASSAHAQRATTPDGRTDLVHRLDSLARSFLADGPAVGATIGVIRGTDTLYLASVGERDRERHLPASTSTVYHIGSITKQFTAAAVMRLVEQGTLHLDDSLHALLPQYPQWRAVSVRQLLNHTSGIHSYTTSARWRRTWRQDVAPSSLVALVAKDTLDFAPGSAWRYNNTGYVLLGMILERVTHTSYADLLAKDFFAPLGLRSATYCPARPTDSEYAKGYEVEAERISVATTISMSQSWAAAALCMSVPDYLRWQGALTNGAVISTESYRLMSTAGTLLNGTSANYGFGLMPGQLGTHRVIHHGGDVHGFSSEALWFPDDSLRVVVFTNTLGSNPKYLADNLASAVLRLPLRVKTTTTARQLTASERARYEGTYNIVMAGGRVTPLRVLSDGNGLAAQSVEPGQGTIRLTYIGDDTFTAEFDASTRIQFVMLNGTALEARFTQRGQTRAGLRRP